MRHPKSPVAALLLLGIAAAPVRAQLVITPVYTNAILTDPQSAAIVSTINDAISFYETRYTNPVNVSITFDKISTGLGQSSTYVGTSYYQDYASQLHAVQNNSAIVQYVPVQEFNPVNGSNALQASLPNFRALGFTGADAPAGQTDSTISINTNITNNDRNAPIDAAKYDLMAVAQHEIDEVLGIGSTLNGLANNSTIPTDAIGTMDLYRFSAPGVRSFDPAASSAYFSVDNGATNVVGFNQNVYPYQGGDYSDWAPTGTHRVQDAFGAPGQIVNFGPAEDLALQAIGYNVALAAPEPSPLASFVVGILGLGALALNVRRRHTAHSR